MAYKYEIQLTGDISGLEESVKKKLGSLAQDVKKNSITIAFDYDFDIKDINKRLNEITSVLSPEIAIQFKYDVNKKLLEQAKKKLSDIQNATPDKFLKDYTNIINEYKSLLNNKSNSADLKEAEKLIIQYYKTAEKYNINIPENINKELYSLDRVFNKLEKSSRIKPLEIYNPNALKDVKNEVSAIEKSLFELKNQGAVDKIGEETSEDVNKLKEELNKLKEILSQSYSIDLDTKVAIQKIEEIQNKLDKLKEQIEIVINPSIPDDFDINSLIINKDNKFQLSKDDYEIITKQLINLSNIINDEIFNSNVITSWKSDFINSINEVYNAFKKTFGKNEVNSIFRQWGMADYSQDRFGTSQFPEYDSRVRERGLFINSKTGKTSNPHIFDAHSHISGRVIKNSDWSQDPFGWDYDTDVHSHPELNSAISLIQGDLNDIGGDLIAYYSDWANGVKHALNSSMLDISYFDIDNFFKDNKELRDTFDEWLLGNYEYTHSSGYDLSDVLSIREKLAEIAGGDNSYFNYIDTFVKKFGSNKDWSNQKIADILKQNWDFSSDEMYNSLINSDKNFINELLEYLKLTGGDSTDLQNLDRKIYNVLFDKYGIMPPMFQSADSNIFEQIFGLKKGLFSELPNDSRGLFDFNFQQMLPEYFNAAFGIDNFNDYFKSYTYDEFEKANPLGLGSDFQKLFDTSPLESFQTSLNSIAESLERIAKLVENNPFENLFQIVPEEELQKLKSIMSFDMGNGIDSENGEVNTGFSDFISKIKLDIAQLQTLLQNPFESTDFSSYLDNLYLQITTFISKTTSYLENNKLTFNFDEKSLQTLSELKGIKDSNISLNEEAKSLTEVFNEAKKAADAKAEFTKANQELQKQADKSSISISDEKRQMDEMWKEYNKSKPKDPYANITDEEIFNQWDNFDEKSSNKDAAQSEKDRLSAFKKYAKEELDLTQKLYNVRLDIAKLDEDDVNNTDKLKALEKEADFLEREIEDRNFLVENLGKEIELEEQHNKLLIKQNEMEAKISVAKENVVIAKTKELSNKKVIDEIAQLQNSVKDYYDTLYNNAELNRFTNSYRESIKELLAEALELSTINIDPTDENSINHLSSINQLLKENVEITSKLNSNRMGNSVKLTGLRSNVEATIGRYGGMDPGLMAKYEGVLSKLKVALSNSADTSIEDVANLTKEVKLLDGELKHTSQDIGTLFPNIKKHLLSINAQFIAQYFSFQDWIRYGRQAIEIVKEVDSALTELRKVSNASDTRLNQSLKQSTQTAKELGASISDVINATSDWSRLGYNIDEAEELARVSTLFQNVGDNMSAESASSYLISTLKGFQLGADQAIDIVDKYNEVANNFAIDTAGIGEALQRSAASFNAAGTDINKSIALVTTTNAVLQNPETVGTLYKTLSARIRGAKNEIIELGDETDAYVESTSKLRDYVKGLTGFDILKEDKQTFKDIYDIILGVSEAWEGLTDLERAGLAEALAGKRAANGLYAVLQNPEDLKNAYKTALEAEGSAAKEQENYARSIQYSIDVFKASLQELATDVVDSSFIKNTVDLGTDIINILDKIIDKVGVLAPLLTAIGVGYTTKKLDGGFEGVKQSLLNGEGFFKTKASIKTQILDNPEYSNLQNTILGKNMALVAAKDLALETDDWSEFSSLSTEIDDLNVKLSKTPEYISNTVKEGAKLSAWGSALKNLGISLAINLAVQAVYSLATANQRLADSSRQAVDSLQEEKSKIDDYSESIQKQYDILNNSSSSYDDQYKARKTLYEIQGELLDQYKDEANSINIVTEGITNQTKALEELNKLKYKGKNDWNSTKNEINSSNGLLDGFTDWLTRFNYGVDSNVELIRRKFESNRTSTFRVGNNNQDFINKALNISGTSFKDGYISVNGTIEEVYDSLVKLQDLSDSYNLDGISNEFGQASNSLRKEIDNFKNQYNEIVLNEDILSSSSGRDVSGKLIKIGSDFEEAIASGSKNGLETSLQNASDLFKSEAFNALSEEAQEYLLNLYPQLKEQIESWEFNINFKTSDGNIISEKDFKNNISQFETSEELQSAFNGDMNLNESQSKALEYFEGLGVSISNIISKAVSEGWIKTQTDVDFNKSISKLSGDTQKLNAFTNEFSQEQKQAWIEVTKGCYTADQAINKYLDSLNKTKTATKAGLIDNVTDLNSGFNVLADIYKDIQEGGDFDFSKLSTKNFSEAFSGLEEEYTAFIEAVSKSPSDITACQSAFDSLATAYVQNRLGIENLSEENEELLSNYLNMLGVVNSEEYAHYMVAKAVAEETYQKSLAKNAGDEVAAIAEICEKALEFEAQGAIDDANAYKQYIYDKLSADVTLMTAGQIEQLSAEASQLGLNISAWVAYYKAKQNLDAANNAGIGHVVRVLDESDGSSGSFTINTQNELDRYRKEAERLANAAYEKTQQKAETSGATTSIQYGGAKSPKSGGGGSSADKTGTDADFKWAERAIEVSKRLMDSVQKLRDDESKSFGDRIKNAKDLITADDKHLENLKKAADLYKNEVTVAEENLREKLADNALEEGKIDEFIQKAKDGSLDPDKWRDQFFKSDTQFLDEDKQAIEDLINAWKEYEGAIDSVADQEKKRHEDAMEMYQLELDQIEAQIDAQKAFGDYIEAYIDLKEATGKLMTVGDYQSMINNNNKVLGLLEEQVSTLRAQQGITEQNSAEWWQIESQIISANTEMLQLQKSSAEWLEKIKMIPIKLLDAFLARLQAIQNMLQRFITLNNSLGVDNNIEEYTKAFELSQEQYNHLLEQRAEYVDLLKEYEWGSDKFNETQEAIENIDASLGDVLESMADFAKAILQLPIDKLGNVNNVFSSIGDALNDLESDFDSVISAVTGVIENNIKEIEKQQEAFDKGIDNQIDGIQKIIDALEEQNELRDKTLAIEQAEYDLAKAQTQKTVAVIQDGQRTFIQDQEAIRNAQQKLDEANFQKRIYDLQQEIKTLEKEKEDRDKDFADQIENLEKISERWSQIKTDIELSRDMLKADQYLGKRDEWLNAVLSGNDDYQYSNIKYRYTSTDADLLRAENGTDANNKITSLVEELNRMLTNGLISSSKYNEVIGAIKSASSDGLITPDEYQQLLLNVYGQEFGNNGTVSSLIKTLNDTMSGILDETTASSVESEKILGFISDQKGNWETLKNQLNELLAQLKESYEEAKRRAAERTTISYSSGDSSSDSYYDPSPEGFVIAGGNHSYTERWDNYSDYAAGKDADYSGQLYWHTGLENGLVDASNDDRLKALKTMALTPLKPDEIPAILQRGEAVLTVPQQKALINNVGNLSRINPGVNVNLTMSNLTFNEISNGQDFANYISRNLSSAIAQSLAK